MEEHRLKAALNDLESLRASGRLGPVEYAERRDALAALLPSADRLRDRRSLRPLLWFGASELACKGALIVYAVAMSL
jgi:hypothetical protein